MTNWIFTAEDRLRNHGIIVEYRWIPSHIGIPGNEAADAAATEAAAHQCDDSYRCTERQCHAVRWASLAHVNRLATETQSRINKEWIQAKLADRPAYIQAQKTMGNTQGLKENTQS
jgi:hypothetical protein